MRSIRPFVYILTNFRRTVLYVGVTSALPERIEKHRSESVPGFSATYRLTDIVYAEECPDMMTALVREKQLKGWRRSKKEALIKSINPEWKDLSNTLN